MAAEAAQNGLPACGAPPWPKRLYRTEAELRCDSAVLHHAHIVRRTLAGWHRHLFQPTAVFYLGNSPAAYVKDIGSAPIDEDDLREWHRFVWNQAVVPFLIVKSHTQIRVYSAQARPAEPGGSRGVEAVLSMAADALHLDQVFAEIESGSIYGRRPKAIDRRQSVDRYLLRNLNATAQELARSQPGPISQENLQFAHEFLTRLLFVCYLLERGMVKGEHFSDPALSRLRAHSESDRGYFLRDLFRDLGDQSKKRAALSRILGRVKTRFNGSLFSESLTKEKRRWTDRFIDAVDGFLQGHERDTGQFTLGFWAYDFSVIPIETISAIYEEFLGAQGQIQESAGQANSRQSGGAYYTPPHLAELTVDIALEATTKPVHELKVLDPACGSGVFLVCLFARMAESLRRARNRITYRPSVRWARDILGLLDGLHGLDVSPTACHITCFSLYLAALEQLTPMDVEELHEHGEKLPELLSQGGAESGRTIVCGNLFDDEIELGANEFNLILGNPPWVSREKQTDPYFLAWVDRQGRDRSVPDKQIAHGFMWCTPEHLARSGVGCLLLPAAVLLNQHTSKFQAQWFKSYAVDRVVDFSDLRRLLFKSAAHPCVAVRFRATAPCDEAGIHYEAPKTDLRSQHAGPVYVREEDTSLVQLGELLRAAAEEQAPVVWKSRLWGTWRDQRLLRRLLQLPKLRELAGLAREGKRWLKGQGFQPFNPKPGSDVAKIKKKKEPEPPSWDADTAFLPASSPIDLVVTPEQCEPVGDRFPLVLFPRDPALFFGPKVLVSQGSRSMKVAFCGFDAIFQHWLQAITGKPEDADTLCFLCAAIMSDVAKYYLFHTSANWGTERDKVLFSELLSLPFLLPGDAQDPSLARSIVQQAARAIRGFEHELQANRWVLGREQEAERVRREVLEPLVRQYYNIDRYEAMLIEDTLHLAIPSSTPTEGTKDIATLREPRAGECQQYAEVLCQMLNHFGTGSKFRVKGRVLIGQPYSLVHLMLARRAQRTVPVVRAGDGLQATIKRLRTILENTQGAFAFCRSLKVFDGNNLYLLKPMHLRYWSVTAALNDADEVAGALLEGKGGQ